MRFPPHPFPSSFSGITNRLFVRPASNATSGPASSSQHPTYLVPRNSRGGLPVYSDVRNAGSRYLISIRNVEGNIKALADELLRDLSDPKLTGSAIINARIVRTNHLVLSGLRRKQVVLDWLARHGF